MSSPDMSVTLYVFPLTIAELDQPNKIGYRLIKEYPDRLVEANDLGYGDFNLANYDMGRNLIVYNDVVYEIFKDYSDITNHKRYFILKPLLRGSDRME